MKKSRRLNVGDETVGWRQVKKARILKRPTSAGSISCSLLCKLPTYVIGASAGVGSNEIMAEVRVASGWTGRQSASSTRGSGSVAVEVVEETLGEEVIGGGGVV